MRHVYASLWTVITPHIGNLYNERVTVLHLQGWINMKGMKVWPILTPGGFFSSDPGTETVGCLFLISSPNKAAPVSPTNANHKQMKPRRRPGAGLTLFALRRKKVSEEELAFLSEWRGSAEPVSHGETHRGTQSSLSLFLPPPAPPPNRTAAPPPLSPSQICPTRITQWSSGVPLGLVLVGPLSGPVRWACAAASEELPGQRWTYLM